MKTVIIGAGQTGRGFLNRLLAESGEKAIFLDKNDSLIQLLNRNPSYAVSFGSAREPVVISNYSAFSISSPDADAALREADLILISVGQNNLMQLHDQLGKDLHEGQTVIVAENGIHPSECFEDIASSCSFELTEAIIFCTTLGKAGSLDIFSENLDKLPYDSTRISHQLSIAGAEGTADFLQLLERKIYTYNCISACIAYAGYEKGYSVYSEAANDPSISSIVDHLCIGLNKSIAEEYHLPLKEQEDFSRMAIRKFSNPNIKDTIDRNVRNVPRKLGKKERIIAPILLMNAHHQSCGDLLYVAACAFQCGIDRGELSKEEFEKVFSDLPAEQRETIQTELGHLAKRKSE